MSQSDGERLRVIFGRLSKQIGVPVQMVSDHGSDVLKAERLFKAEHESIVVTWDVTHRMARLLIGAIQADEQWAAFKTACQQTRKAVQRTVWAALAPPSTKGSSRCEHFDQLTFWGEQTLAQLDAEAHAMIDGEHIWNEAAAESLKSNSNDEVLSRADCQKLNDSLLGQSFPDRSSFVTAVESAIGPTKSTAQIARAADQGRRRCELHCPCDGSETLAFRRNL